MNFWFEIALNNPSKAHRQPMKLALDGGLAEVVQLPDVYRFPVDTERYLTEYCNFLTLHKV